MNLAPNKLTQFSAKIWCKNVTILSKLDLIHDVHKFPTK